MRLLTPARSPSALERLARFCLPSLALLLLSSRASAQCPESSLLFPALGPLYTTEQTYDVTSTDDSWIRGDHRIGEYALHHSGYFAPTDIVARDRFDVTGVPPGTQVEVTLRFLVEGWTYTGGCGGTGCCGYLVATIRDGADTVQATLVGQTFGGRKDFSGVLELPVTLTAGEPRDLEIEMFARRCAGGSAHTVDATGRIVFDGTDPGAFVVSCKEFGPKAVPIRRRSWGEIKSIYR